VRNTLGPIALMLGVLLLSGCATGHGGSLTARFVRPGEPAMDFGGPPVATSDSLQDHIRKVRHVSAAAKPRRSAFGATVEGSDRRLAAALLVEAVLPTAENHLRVAEEYRRLGVFDSAHARLNRAVQQEPHMAEAHEGLARIWRDWGLPGQALGAAYRAAYYDRRSASAQNTLGTILDALGRFGEARHAYQRALSLDPTAAWALNNLCYVEFQLGRLNEARSQCEAALRLAPNLVAAHNNLALTYAAAGDLERARQEFLAAGDSAAAEYNLGIVHLAEREYGSAADAFEQAIKARPTFTEAKARAHAARLRVLTGSD
jgi:tetratricopeptide (TPR) repeat protein